MFHCAGLAGWVYFIQFWRIEQEKKTYISVLASRSDASLRPPDLTADPALAEPDEKQVAQK